MKKNTVLSSKLTRHPTLKGRIGNSSTLKAAHKTKTTTQLHNWLTTSPGRSEKVPSALRTVALPFAALTLAALLEGARLMAVLQRNAQTPWVPPDQDASTHPTDAAPEHEKDRICFLFFVLNIRGKNIKVDHQKSFALINFLLLFYNKKKFKV